MNTRIVLCDARGPLTDLLEKLSGEEGESWLRALNRMLRKENCWDNVFVLQINHSLSREQLLREGAYDCIESDFTEENVPLPTQDKQETVSIELLHLGRNIYDNDATKEAKKRGYRRATPREVLTLGAKHPDLQRQFPIIAAPTGRSVLCLNKSDAGRVLFVIYTRFGWGGDCLFAVVREQS